MNDSNTQDNETRSIGWAVKQLWNDSYVTRSGWNGRGMFLYLVHATEEVRDFVMMKTAQGDRVPWICSQSDLLSTDWELVDPTTV